MTGLIDLHTHSRVSDGTQEPAELVGQAAAEGLGVIALTDHDTVAGWDEAARAAVELGIGLVPGIEISCRHEGISVHLLAYLPDLPGSELEHELGALRERRGDRLHRIWQRVAEDHPISWEDVIAQAEPGATLGRPHLADALVAAGVVPDRSAAFARVLRKGSGYYVELPAPSPEQAIAMVREAGGVSVFAHPAAAARGRVVGDAATRSFIDAGLDGIEVDHRDNPPAERERLRALAQERGLIVTGSSDFHGTGKPNLLGENSTAPEELARLLARSSGAEPIGIS